MNHETQNTESAAVENLRRRVADALAFGSDHEKDLANGFTGLLAELDAHRIWETSRLQQLETMQAELAALTAEREAHTSEVERLRSHWLDQQKRAEQAERERDAERERSKHILYRAERAEARAEQAERQVREIREGIAELDARCAKAEVTIASSQADRERRGETVDARRLAGKREGVALVRDYLRALSGVSGPTTEGTNE